MTDDLTKVAVKRGVDCIGVTVSFICHDGNGKMLLHKRSNNCRDEQGKWDNGGGALEFGETFEEGVVREVKEEYCADAQDVVCLGVYNNIRENGGVKTHWVNVVYGVRVDPAQAKIGEPHKMEDIGWFTSDALPTPEHTTLQRMVQFAKDAGIVS